MLIDWIMNNWNRIQRSIIPISFSIDYFLALKGKAEQPSLKVVIVPPPKQLKIPPRLRADPFLDQRNRIDHIAHLGEGTVQHGHARLACLLLDVCQNDEHISDHLITWVYVLAIKLSEQSYVSTTYEQLFSSIEYSTLSILILNPYVLNSFFFL